MKNHQPSIAIVGTGPSGCYLAQALRKKWNQAQIDMIEQLPVPFGLIRYGVACDHQGTKAVTRQFERLFEREHVQFIGNLKVGQDVSLDQLRQVYDIVVLSIGLHQDRKLGLPGESSQGIYGSGSITKLLNDYPDLNLSEIHFGQHVVIIGHGNVAMDLVRLLAKRGDEFQGSDISPQIQKWIEDSDIQTISVLGRSPIQHSKFDLVMLKEFLKLQHAKFEIHGETLCANHSKLEVFQNLIQKSDQHAPCTVSFYFNYTPQQMITEKGQIQSVVFSHRYFQPLTLPATVVITAIGYEQSEDLNQKNLLDHTACLKSGRLAQGLYCTGWFKRGAKGTIPENRTDARCVAEQIIQDVQSGVIQTTPNKRNSFFEKLASHQTFVDYQGWKKIDAYEKSQSPSNRVRLKVSDWQQLLQLTKQ